MWQCISYRTVYTSKQKVSVFALLKELVLWRVELTCSQFMYHLGVESLGNLDLTVLCGKRLAA